MQLLYNYFFFLFQLFRKYLFDRGNELFQQNSTKFFGTSLGKHMIIKASKKKKKTVTPIEIMKKHKEAVQYTNV